MFSMETSIDIHSCGLHHFVIRLDEFTLTQMRSGVYPVCRGVEQNEKCFSCFESLDASCGEDLVARSTARQQHVTVEQSKNYHPGKKLYIMLST